jgi:ATP-dependent protease Clp ATPase subunit
MNKFRRTFIDSKNLKMVECKFVTVTIYGLRLHDNASIFNIVLRKTFFVCVGGGGQKLSNFYGFFLVEIVRFFRNCSKFDEKNSSGNVSAETHVGEIDLQMSLVGGELVQELLVIALKTKMILFVSIAAQLIGTIFGYFWIFL